MECCWTWCFGGTICLVFFSYTYIHTHPLIVSHYYLFIIFLFDLIEGYTMPMIVSYFTFLLFLSIHDEYDLVLTFSLLLHLSVAYHKYTYYDTGKLSISTPDDDKYI